MTETSKTADQVRRKIAQVFPDRDPDAVLAVLTRYGTEKHEQEPDRVRLAILKLCDEEDAPDLERMVECAKQDFRDILTWAEYPNQSKRLFSGDEQLKAKDKAQYQAWLDK